MADLNEAIASIYDSDVRIERRIPVSGGDINRDRKDLYNMYHLLNHLNLFGGGYLYSVKSIINRYV